MEEIEITDLTNEKEEPILCPFCNKLFEVPVLFDHVEKMHSEDQTETETHFYEREQKKTKRESNYEFVDLQSENLKSYTAFSKKEEIVKPANVQNLVKKRENFHAITTNDTTSLKSANTDNQYMHATNLLKDQLTDEDSENALYAVTKCVVLFDLDNCSSEFPVIIHPDFCDFLLVYVFGGPNLPSVPSDSVQYLKRMYSTTKTLKMVHTPQSAKNAADFALSFHSGLLHQKLPIKIPFIIVSKDKGLAHVIFQLQCLKRNSQIITTNLEAYLRGICNNGLSLAEINVKYFERDRTHSMHFQIQNKNEKPMEHILSNVARFLNQVKGKPKSLNALKNMIECKFHMKKLFEDDEERDAKMTEIIFSLIPRILKIEHGDQVVYT